MLTISRPISDALQHMEDIYTALRKNEITFSKTEAMKIVGSRTTLERLVASKQIRMTVRSESYRKGQWECNAEDVLRHAVSN